MSQTGAEGLSTNFAFKLDDYSETDRLFTTEMADILRRGNRDRRRQTGVSSFAFSENIFHPLVGLTKSNKWGKRLISELTLKIDLTFHEKSTSATETAQIAEVFFAIEEEEKKLR